MEPHNCPPITFPKALSATSLALQPSPLYCKTGLSCVLIRNAFSLMNSDRKFYVVDGQNASLAGGVAMGAIANFMVQPYAAIIIGSAAGLISCYGYRVLQVQ